jgi:hypothetical protein
MDAKKAKKFLEKKIADFEDAVYTFDNILKPRYEADVKILNELKSQHTKLMVLIDKLGRGEDITNEDFEAAVPKEFR